MTAMYKKLRAVAAGTLAAALAGGCAVAIPGDTARGSADSSAHTNPSRSVSASSASSASSAESTAAPSDPPADRVSYTVYQITDDAPEFSEAMNANPIDKDYERDMAETAATAACMATQSRYLDLWKTELSGAADAYAAALSADDRAVFSALHREWLVQTENSLNFEHRVLTGGAYGVELGSGSKCLFIAEKRETYRQRTIRIKYLHYLLETATASPKAAEDCVSLQFLYGGAAAGEASE